MVISVEKFQELEKEYEDLKVKVFDPSAMSDQRTYSKMSRRFKEIDTILHCWKEWKNLEQQAEDCQLMLKTESDQELLDMASMELDEMNRQLTEKEEELKELLLPKDPNDEKNAIVEIRAGTGGEEAALFAAKLFRMYNYFAERMKWKLVVLNSSETELGGFKEVVFSLTGENVYGSMRFESGVHRVQRVPETEASGRIHTSAVTVAVLPEAEEVDIDIKESDLRIDVYRSSGNGGQSVNTTDSAVRITHIPTGVVVTCQDEKSQFKNKDKAMKVLRSRLFDMEIAKQEAEISSQRRAQVGTGDRSAKIRTYNFPQSRVTDHRINLTSYKLDNVLVGELEEFTEALRLAYRNEKFSG